MVETVTVACILPSGLVLRVFDEDGIPRHEPVVLKGTGGGTEPGLTVGIDADLWRRWLIQHADQEYVTSGLVYQIQE